jgi:beta-glucosidase
MPVLKGEYPAELLNMYGPSAPDIRANDMQTIADPLDYLGLNYYTRTVIAHDPDALHALKTKAIHVEGAEYTEMDWEIYPDGLRDLLVNVYNEYKPKEIYVTENGCAMADSLDAAGQVHDSGRVAYLQAHLQRVHQVIQEGLPVKGYFVWSLMDNFEWAFGYSKRFGLIYVDYPTQRRLPKDSYHFYQDVIRTNSVAEG